MDTFALFESIFIYHAKLAIIIVLLYCKFQSIIKVRKILKIFFFFFYYY